VRSFIAHHLLRAVKLEPSQGSRDMSNGKAGIIDQLLELSRGRPAIAEFQVRKSANIGGINIIERVREGQIVLGNSAEKIDDGPPDRAAAA
jgi:hypothetical protein